MIEGEPRYLITDPDALVEAIRTDPPEIFQGSTRGLRDLRHLTRANCPNRFTWLGMNKLYAQVGHGTVGALFPSEEGMISHLDYPYAYEMQTIKKRKDASQEEEELLAKRVTYSFVKTDNVSSITNTMFRLESMLGIYNIPVVADKVGIELVRYRAAGSITMDFYKIMIEREGERDCIITAGHVGGIEFQNELREGFRRRYFSSGESSHA